MGNLPEPTEKIRQLLVLKIQNRLMADQLRRRLAKGADKLSEDILQRIRNALNNLNAESLRLAEELKQEAHAEMQAMYKYVVPDSKERTRYLLSALDTISRDSQYEPAVRLRAKYWFGEMSKSVSRS